MPTLVVVGAFRLSLWSNDHPPPHVHVEIGGEQAVVALGQAAGRAYLLQVSAGMKKSDARRAVQLVEKHRDAALAKWRELHGT